MESSGWVAPRREVKEKGLRWWAAAELWVEVVEPVAVVPWEERLEERMERARFLGRGGLLVGDGMVWSGRGGGRGKGDGIRVLGFYYHWAEREKRLPSALLRDMVLGWDGDGWDLRCAQDGVADGQKRHLHHDFLFVWMWRRRAVFQYQDMEGSGVEMAFTTQLFPSTLSHCERTV